MVLCCSKEYGMNDIQCCLCWICDFQVPEKMYLLSKSCYVNKDYIATLVGAAEGMVLRKHNLKTNGLKQAKKKNAEE